MLDSSHANSPLQKGRPATELMPFTHAEPASMRYLDALCETYPAAPSSVSLLGRVVWKRWGRTCCRTDHMLTQRAHRSCESLSCPPWLASPLLVVACSAALWVFTPVPWKPVSSCWTPVGGSWEPWSHSFQLLLVLHKDWSTAAAC